MALKINTANGSVTLSPEDGSGNVAVAIPRGNLASETYVDTAISTLVDTAPDALNTLNELAAALSDDANFATTVTDSLALKAPLASPNFTGTVTADGLDIGNINIGNATNTIASTASLLFDIDSNDNQSTAVFKVTTNNQTKNLFNMEENGDISFYENTGTTPKFFWDSSAESLGIGTSSPQYLGHFVNGDIAIVSTDITNDAEKQSLLFGGASGEAAGLASITGYRGSAPGIGELIFKTNPGGGITEAMRIASTGNVGIDNNNPTEKLDVTGTVKATNYTDTVYALSGTEIDPANGGIQTKTLSGATTFTEVLSSGESVVLMIDGGDANVVTWPTITWVTSAGNAAPTLTANDTIVLWKVSTTLYGAYTGSYT
jgi:hypothetical protein